MAKTLKMKNLIPAEWMKSLEVSNISNKAFEIKVLNLWKHFSYSPKIKVLWHNYEKFK